MLKVAIVGCGMIVRKKHLPAFLKLRPEVEVAALCDLNQAQAKDLAESFNIKKVYTDFSQMLQEVRPDIVDICTPPSTHARLSTEAIQKNCHVLLEKPMALSVADCDAIIDAANKHNRKVCVIHNQIFNPAFVEARNIISQGKLGRFQGMKILFSTPLDYMTAKETHWAHQLPGGVLSETGPHAVYLSLAFLDHIKETMVRAKKQFPEFPWSRFEDFRIDLLAENGISSIALVYSSNQWVADVEIFASRGILKVDLENNLLVKYNRPELKPFSIGTSTLNSIYQITKGILANGIQYLCRMRTDTHYIIISRFIESVLNATLPPITPEEAREAVRVMELLVKDLKK
jgi:predicted dehydrogenase